MSKNDRKKFNSVLIVDVHNRDIIDRFVRDRSVVPHSPHHLYWALGLAPPTPLPHTHIA